MLAIATSAFAVGLPAALFVLSLLRISQTARAYSEKDFAGVIWLGIYVMVNVLACIWSATMLSDLLAHSKVSDELVERSFHTGSYLFVLLATVLLFRPAMHSLARALVRKKPA